MNLVINWVHIAHPIVANIKNQEALEIDILNLSFKWLTKVGIKKSNQGNLFF